MDLEKIRLIGRKREKLKRRVLTLGTKVKPGPHRERLSQEQIERFLDDTKPSWLEPIRREAIVNDSFGLPVSIPAEILRDGATAILRAIQGLDPTQGTYVELSRFNKSGAWKIQQRHLNAAEYNDSLKARDRTYFDEALKQRHGQHAANCAEILGAICQHFHNFYFDRDPEIGDTNFVFTVLAYHLYPLPIPSRKFVKKVVAEWRRGKAWRHYEWVKFSWVGGVERLLGENVVEMDLSYILNPIKMARQQGGEPTPKGEIPSAFRLPLDKNERVWTLINNWRESKPVSGEEERRQTLLDALERAGKTEEADKIRQLWKKTNEGK